jgi:hypothetical protein
MTTMRQAPYYFAVAICGLFALVGLALFAFLAVSIEARKAGGHDAFRVEWLVVGLFATVFTVIGTVACVLVVKQKRLVDRLLREGLRREGAIVDFVQVEERQRSGKRGWRTELVWYVVVEWTDQAGKLWRERGDRSLRNPATRFTMGDKVVVLVDPRKPEKFWIDFEGESNSVQQGISTGSGNVGLGDTKTTPVVRR